MSAEERQDNDEIGRDARRGIVAGVFSGEVRIATAGLSVVGISGSPSSTSRSRALVEHMLACFQTRGAASELIDLAGLPADALLGRAVAAAVTTALETTAKARIVVAGTPVYRATYSGLLKLYFDLLPQDSLVGKIGVPIATGHGTAHALAVDHGLRPLFASLGATVVAAGVYGTSAQFQDGNPGAELLQAVDRAVREAWALAGATAGDRQLQLTDRGTDERNH